MGNLTFNLKEVNKKYIKRKLKSFVLCSIILFSNKAISQIGSVEIIKQKIDTVVKRNTEFSKEKQKDMQLVLGANNVVTAPTYKRYIDEYFTYLSYNRGVLPTGNSAAVDLSEEETQLKLSLSKKIQPKQSNGGITIATAGVQSKVEDNITTFFNGRNATTGTTIFGNFAFLPNASKGKHHLKQVVTMYIYNPSTNTVDSVTTSFDKLNVQRKQFKAAFDKKYTDEYSKKYKALLGRWVEIDSAIQYSSDSKSVADLFREKEEIEKTLKDAGLVDKEPDAIANSIQEEYENNLFSLETDEPTWEWIQLSWLSGGISYTRETYNTYNNALEISKRFDEKNFDSWSFNIAKHWFKERVQEAGLVRLRYFNINYNLARTNSYSDISDETVTQSIRRGTAGDTTITLESNKNTKNITGVDFKTGWKHTIGSTYTAMLGQKQSFGINLLGNVQISGFTPPIYNTHIGFLFRFLNNQRDPDDEKSPAKVNFEVFIRFPDMTDVAESDKSVWQNRIIGASVSVPFNKIFFK